MAKLFLVDDHDVMRRSISRWLLQEPDFVIIDEASSAEEALEKLESTNAKPDLILVDASLPGMSGIDFISEVRGRWPELRCVVLSGYQGPVYEEKALNAGAAAYINKDTVLEIVPAIRRALGDGNTS